MAELAALSGNPFPGLRPFEFDENYLFFGRDGQSDELMRNLRIHRFVAVVGTSGSGKSSLVRAGLLPGLYGGMMSGAGSNWRIAVIRPGGDPIGNLAEALSQPDMLGRDDDKAEMRRIFLEATLRRSETGLSQAVRQAKLPENENLFVVVDQFEEIFRFRNAADAEGRDESAAFVKMLLDAAQQEELPIYVALTMRSDFLGDCAQFHGLPQAINDSQYLIPRMTRSQRRQAIIGPVAVGGGEMTQRLINRLLNDVGENPDQLPILQHALMRTWNYWREVRKNGEPIDLPHYEAIGKMERALSLHADEAYNELSGDKSRRIAEIMFKALTERGADNREIRRPIRIADLCEITDARESKIKAIIETFRKPGRTFLMPPHTVSLHKNQLIDISHESLIRNWERLKGWVREEAESAAIYRRLAQTAVLHKAGDAGLWRDPDLTIALQWLEEKKPTEAWAKRYHPDFSAAETFVEKSREKSEAEEAAKTAAHQRELEQAQTLAREQEERAKVESQRALEQQRRAEAEKENALAQTKRAEAERGRALEQEQRAQDQAVAASRLRKRAYGLVLLLLFALVAAGFAIIQYFEANEQRDLAVANLVRADENKRIAEANARDAIVARNGAVAARDSAQVSERKALLEQRRAQRERARAVARKKEADYLRGVAEVLADSANRQTLLAQREKSKADSLRAQTEQLKRILGIRYLVRQSTIEQDSVLSVKIARAAYAINAEYNAPDSSYYDAELADEVYDALRTSLNNLADSSGGPGIYTRHADWSQAVAFSPDGKLFASGGADSIIVLRNLKNGTTKTLSGHKGRVRALAFDSLGDMLVSGADDRSVLVWPLKRLGQPPQILSGHRGWVRSLAFTPDGRLIVSGSSDQTIRIWKNGGGVAAILENHSGSVRSVAITRDGDFLASTSPDGTVRLWDIQTLSSQPVREFALYDAWCKALAFSHDDQFLAGAGSDGKVRAWPVSGGEALVFEDENPVEMNAIVFSPDDGTLATGDARGVVKLWDFKGKNLKQPKITLNNGAWIWSMAYSPNGGLLAVASSDKSVRVWNASSDVLEKIAKKLVKGEMSLEEWENIQGETLILSWKELQKISSKF